MCYKPVSRALAGHDLLVKAFVVLAWRILRLNLYQWRCGILSIFFVLNSSTIDELGSWCLRRAGGAGQQFWQRGGGIHRNPASGHRPGTVTLIESVEYLPAPNTYPREGGVGKKSSAKWRQANRKTIMTWKGQQASKRNARGAPAKLKRPPQAVLKEMTAGRHCLEINLA